MDNTKALNRAISAQKITNQAINIQIDNLQRELRNTRWSMQRFYEESDKETDRGKFMWRTYQETRKRVRFLVKTIKALRIAQEMLSESVTHKRHKLEFHNALDFNIINGPEC